MLARKLKCLSCGANKVTEPHTSYVFCDYCGSFMGFEFRLLEDESKKAFQKSTDDVKAFLAATQSMGDAMKRRDGDLFISSFLQYQEAAYKILPANYSPKIKVDPYRKSSLNYLRHFFQDKMEDHFFEEQENAQAVFADYYSKVNTKMVNNRYLMIYDENLEKYIDAIYNHSRESAQKAMSYPSINLYPEPVNSSIGDMILKQSVSAYVKLMEPEDFERLVNYLGFQSEYIEIPDVKTVPQDCAFCHATLIVAEGAQQIICEYCGNKNQAGMKAIACANCGATFDPDASENRNQCPYCSSFIQAL